MATQTIKIVEDNTAPPIALTLKRGTTVINLTGASVALIISNGSVITNTGHQTCTIVSAVAGTITYSPQVGDFPTKRNYKCDVEITYGDGTVERLYDQLIVKARKKLV